MEYLQVLDLPRKGKISTGRSVLEKLDNPIANMIIDWRKMSMTQSKVHQVHALWALVDVPI